MEKNDITPAAGETTPAAPTEPQVVPTEPVNWQNEAAKWRRIAEKNPALPTEKNPSSLDEVESRVDLRMDGYSKDEANEIISYAKFKNISIKEAIEAPILKKGMEALRAEKKNTDSTLSPSHRGFTFKGKSYDQVLTDPASTKTEKQAAFDARLRSRKGQGSPE